MTIEKLKESEPLFGCWYVEAKVAEGRSSKVFKVSKTEEGKSTFMCLKTVRFPGSNNEVSKAIASGKYNNVDEYLAVLESEVKLNMEKMLQLRDNGNIVRFEDYCIVKESSCFYVVMLMELLTPLSDYLKADKIKPKEVIKIGWDLCNALEGFRHEGIMHHNIRPDNIYVDSKGNYKLGDFGISDIGEQTREPGGYSAPELFSGSQVDSASDIYSLGVVLYKLLNNNRGPFLPPFPAPISLADREQATVRRLRGDLFSTPANADYNLAKIVFKAAAFRPEERYEAPFMMRRDLERYLQALASAPVAPVTGHAAKTHHVGSETPRRPRPDGAQSVTAADKNDFAEAFTDDEADSEEKPDKKWYFIIMALVVVLALVIGLVVKSSADRKKEPVTEDTTTSATTIEITTTEELTTEETTTEETTTEETTTEETTTEETTTEETTTEETTTEETTTEETTAEETTAAEETTEPILVGSVNTAGSQNEDGKYFINLESYSVTDGLSDADDKQISVEISDDLGPSPQPSGDVYVYMMIDAVHIQTIKPQVSLQENDDGTYLCSITIYDEEFFYEPSDYQYYLCFEEGAIESETSLILPVQIKL
ncbi:MAG: protein kinase [Clostridia bacterium]|nr:protein kinase [Clostridia bacterium]